TRPSASTASPSGSGTTSATKSVGLDGYCPVCIIEMKQWVKGKPEYQVTYDGHVYHFPGEEQRQTFLKNPAKYVPAMGGNCIVCAVNMKQKVPGSVMHTALYRGRLYLFPGADQKEMFRKNPAKYASADVALGGNCSVCRVEMNQEVKGDPNISAFYKDKLYLFPGDKQREMFLANPAKYAE
ncbi:MAG: hypothetical protein AAF664_22375, partial [Planctomycetota bacterium]